MLEDIRKSYDLGRLDEEGLPVEPSDLFSVWLREVLESGQEEPTAMTLSTCADGWPDSRIVLLKEMTREGFSFFTNYQSAKGRQLLQNPHVALNFFWPVLERQVRISGTAVKLTEQQSVDYFRSRPRESQLGAWASGQSQVIANRKTLEDRYSFFEKLYAGKEINKPDYWGGYRVIPSRIEFWQGRSGRLHDRIVYERNKDRWKRSRLAP
jgi:pyridoxamine 5'-phosphate oxidase